MSDSNDDLSVGNAREQFKNLIDWMKAIADEKMKTEEGRQWLRDNWGILVP
jgi:hypothetical protein